MLLQYVQTQAPSIEPVTVADVRLQARIIDASEDALLQLMIGAARRYAETYTGRSFVTQKWRAVGDAFPGQALMGVRAGISWSIPDHALVLEKGPIQLIDSITYTAMDGTTQIMPGTDWVADLTGTPRITPRFGKIWPIPLPQIGSVAVNFTAGYGDTADTVPEGIRHWILLRVATLYERREEVAEVTRGKIEALPFVDGLLDPYRLPRA